MQTVLCNEHQQQNHWVNELMLTKKRKMCSLEQTDNKCSPFICMCRGQQKKKQKEEEEKECALEKAKKSIGHWSLFRLSGSSSSSSFHFRLRLITGHITLERLLFFLWHIKYATKKNILGQIMHAAF